MRTGFPSPATPQIEQKRPRRNAERGFVLLVVLSTLGLLALVAASFAQIARTHIKVVAVASESARAESLADAGVNMAILDLVSVRENPVPSGRFAHNAAPFTCSFGSDGATLTIAVQDEAGKVDLNIGSEALVRALILGLGADAGEAAVDAILDFRDEDDDRRPSGAERAEYRAAGRSYGPKNAPFFAVEELASVLGLTQAHVVRLRPFVTIYSGQTAIDSTVASDALVDAIARGMEQGRGAPFKSRQPGGRLGGMGRGPLPDEFLSASTRRAFSLHAEARTAGGAVFVREAVIEFAPSRAAAFVVRRWHRGAARIGVPAATSMQGLPPC